MPPVVRYGSQGRASCLNSVFNVKVLVDAFNQEKALVEAFSLIVNTDGTFAALNKMYTAHNSVIVVCCSSLPLWRLSV